MLVSVIVNPIKFLSYHRRLCFKNRCTKKIKEIISLVAYVYKHEMMKKGKSATKGYNLKRYIAELSA